jgi:hypothetical protein
MRNKPAHCEISLRRRLLPSRSRNLTIQRQTQNPLPKEAAYERRDSPMISIASP